MVDITSGRKDVDPHGVLSDEEDNNRQGNVVTAALMSS